MVSITLSVDVNATSLLAFAIGTGCLVIWGYGNVMTSDLLTL